MPSKSDDEATHPAQLNIGAGNDHTLHGEPTVNQNVRRSGPKRDPAGIAGSNNGVSTRAALGDFGRSLLALSGARLVQHAHREYQAIVQIAGPSTEWTIGRKAYQLRPGTALLLNPWEQHARTNVAVEPSLLLSLLVRPEWIRDATGWRNARFARPLEVVDAGFAGQIGAAHSALLGPVNGADDTVALRLESLIKALFAAFAVERVPALIDHRVRRALRYVMDAQSDDLRVDSLPGVAAMSRSQFFDRFRQEVGATPHQVIASTRMDRAIRRLSTSDESISSIAFDLGFATPSHFSRFLIQRVMATPGEYRQAARYLRIEQSALEKAVSSQEGRTD